MILRSFKSVYDPIVIRNPNGIGMVTYGAAQQDVLNHQGLEAAAREISTWPGYEPTPLIVLPGLATAADVAALYYKDEGRRFGLGSFKPLGGSYAVFRVIQAQIQKITGEALTSSDLISGKLQDLVKEITVCAASDGNHGRAVAWGSRLFGCRSIIFLNEAVSTGREKAIAGYGAETRRVAGSYDDAVRVACDTARAEGWHIVPDTASGGNVSASRNVMQGYALLADEVASQLADTQPPSHLFIQAGVGGLAAAVCGQLWQAYGDARPITIIVEPENAACWFESIQTGAPATITGDLDSLMAGLACGEPSSIAWPILRQGAFAAMKIPDAAAAETMRILATGANGDPAIVGGESGVAGLAAFLIASHHPAIRTLLQLNEKSQVLVVGSESDTDPETYARIVGRSGDEVRASAAQRNTQ